MSARKAMSPPVLVAAEVIHDSWDYIAGSGGEKILSRVLPARAGCRCDKCNAQSVDQVRKRINNHLSINH